MALEDDVRTSLARGDRDGAASAAIASLGPAILAYLRGLHDGDDAEDVFQAWAEDVWRGVHGFRGEGSLRAWGYRLAWHASRRFERNAWRRHRVSLPASAASRLAASCVRSAPTRRDERLDVLRRALGPEDHTLLLLRLDRELPWEDVADVLGARPEALRKRFERLKRRLGRIAREKGLLA